MLLEIVVLRLSPLAWSLGDVPLEEVTELALHVQVAGINVQSPRDSERPEALCPPACNLNCVVFVLWKPFFVKAPATPNYMAQ